jgi:hypothetical protein
MDQPIPGTIIHVGYSTVGLRITNEGGLPCRVAIVTGWRRDPEGPFPVMAFPPFSEVVRQQVFSYHALEDCTFVPGR